MEYNPDLGQKNRRSHKRSTPPIATLPKELEEISS